MDLVYKNEQKLFVISLVISVLVWVAVLALTLGFALLWIPIGFLFYAFAHSAFISYIKGTAVKVSETQYPDIHQRLLACCQAIGLEKVPECYILRTDTFNALATKFLGRNYVVLFSDAIDALATKPEALNFYIGHELGHIHRKHLNWNLVLLPAKLLPLLGAAYSRACESTCDRYGFACCKNAPDAALAGLLAIASSDTRYLSTDVNSYVAQAQATNGFWMSYHELTGGYPWLVKRVAAIDALAQGREAQHPRRHIGAWILACLGGGRLLVTVAIVAIIAAIVIPAYRQIAPFFGLSSFSRDFGSEYDFGSDNFGNEETQDLSIEQVRVLVDEALVEAEPFQAAVTQFAMQRKVLPTDGDELETLPEQTSGTSSYYVTVGDAGTVAITFYEPSISGTSVVLTPTYENGVVTWSCYSLELVNDALPAQCHE